MGREGGEPRKAGRVENFLPSGSCGLEQLSQSPRAGKEGNQTGGYQHQGKG